MIYSGERPWALRWSEKTSLRDSEIVELSGNLPMGDMGNILLTYPLSIVYLPVGIVGNSGYYYLKYI